MWSWVFDLHGLYHCTIHGVSVLFKLAQKLSVLSRIVIVAVARVVAAIALVVAFVLALTCVLAVGAGVGVGAGSREY